MYIECRNWIVNIIKDNIGLIKIALKQRAKFEGWLKFEIAYLALKKGAVNVQVEARYNNTYNNRSDVSFEYSGIRYDLELKTPNSNWGVEGIVNKTRPITRNIQGIINDANKICSSLNRGLIAFVLFPLPYEDKRWYIYLKRISNELNIELFPETHCSLVDIPLNENKFCQCMICCFPYPQSGH